MYRARPGGTHPRRNRRARKARLAATDLDRCGNAAGRRGFRRSFDTAGEKGGFAPYLKANCWRNFGDDSQLGVGIDNIATERNDSWAEVGFGFSLLTKHDWTIFMQYDYEKGLGQSDLHNYSGTVGLRRSW